MKVQKIGTPLSYVLFMIKIDLSFNKALSWLMKLSEAMVACMGVPSIQTTTATPMRSSEVKANTTWESLQTARAVGCVPLGLMSTLVYKIKGKFDL